MPFHKQNKDTARKQLAYSLLLKKMSTTYFNIH